MRRRRYAGGARAPWARRRRRALLVLACGALCLAPALIWRLSLRAELNQRMSDLREAALPLTMEELNARYAESFTGSDSEALLRDIFAHYTELDMAAFEHLPKFESGESRLLELPYSTATREALASRVAGNEAMLAALIRAASVDRIRLVRNVDWRHLAEGSDLERPFEVLCAQVCLQAEQGNGDAALENLIAGLRVARACRPTATAGMLNRVIGYEYMLASVLPAVAVRTPVSGEKIQALEALIRSDDWEGDLAAAAQGERCIQLVWNRPEEGALGTIFSIVGVYDRKKIQILDYYDIYADLAVMSLDERHAFIEANGMVYDYSYVRPSLSRSYDPLVVALMRHYQRAGRFPESLDGLEAGLIAPGPAMEENTGRTYVGGEKEFSLDDVQWAVTLTGAVREISALPAGG